MRPCALAARALSTVRARSRPVKSTMPPRRNRLPASSPRTNPASGRTSYKIAAGPGTPVRAPEVRTSPARSSLASAPETVGLDSRETRARSARESCPARRMCSSSSCSFIARSSGWRAGEPGPATTSATFALPRITIKLLSSAEPCPRQFVSLLY